MITCSIFWLFIISILGVQSVSFENVTLFLTSRWTKLYVDGHPATNLIFIKSSNNLGDFINLQPLEIVKIQNQNVRKLEKDSVANLPNVMDLAITHCGVEEIESGTFWNVPKLDYLNLSHNSLGEIKNDVFSGLNLISLFLNDNKISTLGNKVFNNMTLGHLFLDNNKISSWSSDWFKGTSLNSIFLSNNLLEELPTNAFDYFVELGRLDYHVTLQNLFLDGNKLKKIHPKALEGIEDIDFLSLRNNSLEKLPSNVFHTVRYVKTLDLSNNKISNVDEALRNTAIMYLKLNNNKLSCFPVEVYNVTKIHHLSMDGNPVTCECVRTFEKWQQESLERIVYLEEARKNCIN